MGQQWAEAVYNNLTLVYCAFPRNLLWLTLYPHLLLWPLAVDGILGGGFYHFDELLNSWVSSMHIGGIPIIQL